MATTANPAGQSRQGLPSTTAGDLTIAVAAKWSSFPGRLHWALAHDFAIAYAPDPQALDSLPRHVAHFRAVGIPVRYHGFFPGYEMGHPDPALAERGLRLHIASVEALAAPDPAILTVHVGLDWQAPLDPGRVVENLGRLAARGRELGVTVALENLRRGPASSPADIAAWARAADAMLTLDVGHAFGCAPVLSGMLTIHDVVELFADRLVEVHIYERETDRHYPPQDIAMLGPVIDRLLTTSCRWWTIELDDEEEVLATRALLRTYLETAQTAG